MDVDMVPRTRLKAVEIELENAEQNLEGVVERATIEIERLKDTLAISEANYAESCDRHLKDVAEIERLSAENGALKYEKDGMQELIDNYRETCMRQSAENSRYREALRFAYEPGCDCEACYEISQALSE